MRGKLKCTAPRAGRIGDAAARVVVVAVCAAFGLMGFASDAAAQAATIMKPVAPRSSDDVSDAPLPSASATLKVSDDASISLGIGLRGMYTSTQDAAPNGTSRSNTFSAEDAAPFISGQWRQFAAFLHFDIPCASPSNCPFDMRMLDAIGEFNMSEEFNVWGGRLLPPTDRGNLAGRFYAETWEPPTVASNYPSIFGGRDNGVMAWGTVLGGKLAYSAGAFNGHDRAPGLSDQSDRLLYAGRLQVNFWDAEAGYNRPASYLGQLSLFSIGLATNYQSSGVGTAAKPGNLSIWSVDVLVEKKLPGGWVPTLTGAYYKYNLGGAIDCGSGEPGSTPCPSGYDNVGGQVAGHSYLVSGLLLFPQKLGWGQVQPFVRYQQYNRDVSQTTNKETDVGLNYIIDGFNVKLTAMYSRYNDSRNPTMSPALPASSNQFLLGMQFQF
jgi:hypothetical protein